MKKTQAKKEKYLLARTANKVFWGVYEGKAKGVLEKIGHDGVHVDIIVYDCPIEVVEMYTDRLGDELVPFALAFYGTILARGQGLIEEKVKTFLDSCDSHFGVPRPTDKE